MFIQTVYIKGILARNFRPFVFYHGIDPPVQIWTTTTPYPTFFSRIQIQIRGFKKIISDVLDTAEAAKKSLKNQRSLTTTLIFVFFF
jgi:hypothetical protein